jgi:hypothetical protein
MGATRELCVAVFGSVRRAEAWEGPLALCALCLVPGLALAEVLALVALLAYGAYWRARRAIGRALHGLAELLVPTAAEQRLAVWKAYRDGWAQGRQGQATYDRGYELGYEDGRRAALLACADSLPASDAAAEVIPDSDPVLLVMPSAPQVTTGQDGPAVQLDAPTMRAVVVEGDVIVRALDELGSVRAAARQLGMAESTLRGRCRKLGIATPRARKGS